MKNIFGKVVLLVLAMTVVTMTVRMLTVLIPKRPADTDTQAGLSYLAERETAIYTEPTPSPTPTEVPTVPTAGPTEAYMDIPDNNFRAAFKDIYFCGDSIVEAMSGYDILDSYHVIAAIGVGTSHIDKNLTYIVAPHPKYLILHYGVNVIDVPEYADTFIANYKASIQKLQEQLPDTVIFVDSIFPVQEKAYKQAPGTKYIDYYNERIYEMTQELGVHYIDHTPQWAAFEKNYYEGDGIHPVYSYYKEKYLPYIYTEVMKTT